MLHALSQALDTKCTRKQVPGEVRHNCVNENGTARMQNHDGDLRSTDAEEQADSLLKDFAVALGRELDRIGYPAAPARTNRLSEDLGLGRMQAYRIGRGDNMPTLKALMKLQGLGVSLGAVFGELPSRRRRGHEVTMELLGVTLKASTLPTYARTGFAASHKDGRATMRALAPGEELGVDEVPVGGLLFSSAQRTVAIVEDHPDDLEILCKQINEGFSVQPFQRGRALLENAARLASFDAIVIDWRLPDIDGATLVNLIRAQTRAPIIVTTGEHQESQAISQVLHLPNIRYVAKPVDGNILRAMLTAAISEANGGTAPSHG